MKEKIVYEACDGKTFLNKEECERYERKVRSYIMWGTLGEVDLYDANVIYFASDKAVKIFIRDMIDKGYPWTEYNGIGLYSSAGWYVWVVKDEDGYGEYVRVPTEVADNFVRAYSEMK